MVNKKMSDMDKIKRQFLKANIISEGLSAEITQKYLKKIRTESLRDLCITYILALKEKKVFMTAEDIQKITGFSLRKSYDILNTLRFLENAQDKLFELIKKGGVENGN